MADVKTVPAPRDEHLRKLANCIRFLSMDAVQRANSGHPGMPVGMADIATVLYRDFLKFDASDPYWFDRDRFLISNGHGSMLLYSLLYLTGYEDMTIDQIKAFRQIDGKTAGHPEYHHATGIETTTGPLGQGIANSVGFALAERIMNAKFGDALSSHFTYVFLGDGCMMEGISHEAISLAGHLKLGKLIAFWDNNSISIDGATSLAESDDHPARFRAAKWHVLEIDGHDTDAIHNAIVEAQNVADQPSLIACRTVIGFGFPTGRVLRRRIATRPARKKSRARANCSIGRRPPSKSRPIFLMPGAGSARRATKHAWPGLIASRRRKTATSGAA